MAHWFEDLTKTIADEKMGRRTAMRRIAGTVAGAAFASAIPKIAEAKRNKHCFGGSDCSGEFSNCVGISNTNCFCFIQLGGKPGCGCNSYCSQVPTCSHSSKCPKGYLCIVSTGCNCSTSQGVCVPNCALKKNRNCVLGSGHGVTAAGVL